MKFLYDRPIAIKAAIAPLAAILFLVLLWLTGLSGMRDQKVAIEDLYGNRFSTYQAASGVANEITAVHGNIYRIIAWAISRKYTDELQKNAEEQDRRLKKIVAELQTLTKAPNLTADEHKEFNRLAEQAAEYSKVASSAIDMLSTDASFAAINMENAGKEFDRLHKTIGDLVALEKRYAKEQFDFSLASFERNQRIFIVVALLAMLAAAVLTLVVTRVMTRAIGSIREAANELRNGDLTRRVRVRGNDEIGQTASAFNELIANFQDTVGRVHSNASEVSAAATQLTAAANHVAGSSAQQSDAAMQTAAAVEEMTASVALINDSTGQLRGISNASLEHTHQGAISVEELQREMKTVSQAVDSMSSSIAEFVRSAQSINNMTQVVKDIADQTNLLALNAAIEAARAGEQGRGFAVVADEVRKLAEKSSSTAGQIESVTVALTQQSADVQRAILSGADSLHSSERYLDTVARVLEQANESVNETNQGVDQIADTIRQQSESSQQIAEHIERIARMAEDNTAASEETSVAARQLEALSSGLLSAVERFRV